MNDKVLIGYKDCKPVYCSQALIEQYGMDGCRERMGIGVKEWPVKTDLSGTIVMVKGATHQDAIDRYLNRIDK